MAIATLAEIKTYLGITDNSKDTIITALMKPVQYYIHEYCNNDFLISTALTSDKISITSPDTIDITESKFTDYLKDGFNFKLSGSKYNDGLYEIDTIADYQIATFEQTLTSEAVGNSISMQAIKYPLSLKPIYSMMINEQINAVATGGLVIASQSLGDSSISYFNPTSLVFSMSAEIQLQKYIGRYVRCQ